MADFPKLNHAAAYMIYRTSRVSWMVGQVMTMIVVTLLYALFLLISSMLLSVGHVITGNEWSETATMLSYAPSGFDPAIEVTRKAMKLTSPYGTLFHVFFLFLMYMILLGCLQLAVTIYCHKKAGITAALIVNFIGFLLTPNRFLFWLSLPTNLQYIANVLSAWVSPLQHATYLMHNFGYDLLPSIGDSVGIMGGVSMAFVLMAVAKMKTFQFYFVEGER